MNHSYIHSIFMHVSTLHQLFTFIVTTFMFQSYQRHVCVGETVFSQQCMHSGQAVEHKQLINSTSCLGNQVGVTQTNWQYTITGKILLQDGYMHTSTHYSCMDNQHIPWAPYSMHLSPCLPAGRIRQPPDLPPVIIDSNKDMEDYIKLTYPVLDFPWLGNGSKVTSSHKQSPARKRIMTTISYTTQKLHTFPPAV